METKVYTQSGKEAGKVTLNEGVFGLSWNADLVHKVVTAMQANMRDPIAHTKTRGEVSGTGKKPWQQKGTGRARHGSRRSPIWVGGGVAHGPRKDKNYSQKINKKAKTKALHTILSRKFKDGEILILEDIAFTAPKTAEAKKVVISLAAIKGFEKLVTKPKNVALIATMGKSDAVVKSFRNFGNIAVEEFRNINPLSVMNHKYLIISKEALK